MTLTYTLSRDADGVWARTSAGELCGPYRDAADAQIDLAQIDAMSVSQAETLDQYHGLIAEHDGLDIAANYTGRLDDGDPFYIDPDGTFHLPLDEKD